MQMYKVMMLPLAEEDIINNTDYIAFKKKAPETALELAMGFRNTIAKLEFMPKQHELDEDEELAARQIRKCYYKNYKIYQQQMHYMMFSLSRNRLKDMSSHKCNRIQIYPQQEKLQI